MILSELDGIGRFPRAMKLLGYPAVDFAPRCLLFPELEDVANLLKDRYHELSSKDEGSVESRSEEADQSECESACYDQDGELENWAVHKRKVT